ncbi:Short-chain dehydrogenase/reductase SDR [plant metagenome]
MAKTILVTGAGTGFGHDLSLQLAQRGHQVIATVELPAQVTQLKNAAQARGVNLRVEKIDILSERDRAFAASLDADVLVNNAGIGEGGSVAEMPMDVFRSQFETNVFATLALTQQVVRRLLEQKKPGKIIFISSVVGFFTPEFTGAYSASKHALEAVAEALHAELKPFDIKVATINPGPYRTGFNDRMMETHRQWYDPSRHLIDHSKLAFTYDQFDPSAAIDSMVAIVEQSGGKFRNVVPDQFAGVVKQFQANAWDATQ